MIRFRLPTAAVVTALAFVSGCSTQVPVASSFPYTEQKKMQSATHWEQYAQDVVAGLIQKYPELPRDTVCVSEPISMTVFNQAFQNYLAVALANAGVAPVPCDGADVRITTSTQLVVHDTDRAGWPTGLASGAGVGIAAAEGVGQVSSWGAGAVGLLVTGAADLAAGHYAMPTHTDLIITIKASNPKGVLMARADNFYVNDRDRGHYLPMAAPAAPSALYIPPQADERPPVAQD